MRTRRTLTVNWLDLIDLSGGGRFWNVTSAQAFEILRWMIQTADGYSEHRSGPYELLFRHPNCTGCSPYRQAGIGGEGWWRQLRESLLLAITGSRHNGAVCQWRKDHKISPMGTATIPVRYLVPKYRKIEGHPCTDSMLSELLELKGRFHKSPNRYHRHAVWVRRCRILTYGTMHVLELRYGYKRDSSEWGEKLACMEKNEVFDSFVARAWDRAKELVRPELPWSDPRWS